MDWTSSTDGQLAGAFAQGGANEPFEELVRRYGAMVFRTCRRVTGNHQDAEDAMQLVFAALAGNAAELTSYRSLGGWLYSTAWHIARHVQRSHLARRQRELRALRPGPTEIGEPGDEAALAELYRALELLPPDYRDVVVLHHLQGMTIDQVADVLASNQGTIASRLSRARAMIRQRLAERELLWSAGVVSWMLSAEWTTDHEMVPPVVISEATDATACAIGIARGVTTRAAAQMTVVAASATWGIGKCAMAAGVSVLALGATSMAVSQVIQFARPTKQVLRASASASATAENTAAGKNEESTPEPRVSKGSSSPPIASVPEPTVLPAIGLGMLALRRRRAR